MENDEDRMTRALQNAPVIYIPRLSPGPSVQAGLQLSPPPSSLLEWDGCGTTHIILFLLSLIPSLHSFFVGVLNECPSFFRQFTAEL